MRNLFETPVRAFMPIHTSDRPLGALLNDRPWDLRPPRAASNGRGLSLKFRRVCMGTMTQRAHHGRHLSNNTLAHCASPANLAGIVCLKHQHACIANADTLWTPRGYPVCEMRTHNALRAIVRYGTRRKEHQPAHGVRRMVSGLLLLEAGTEPLRPSVTAEVF